jgi:hypothetical protein
MRLCVLVVIFQGSNSGSVLRGLAVGLAGGTRALKGGRGKQQIKSSDDGVLRSVLAIQLRCRPTISGLHAIVHTCQLQLKTSACPKWSAHDAGMFQKDRILHQDLSACACEGTGHGVTAVRKSSSLLCTLWRAKESMGQALHALRRWIQRCSMQISILQ